MRHKTDKITDNDSKVISKQINYRHNKYKALKREEAIERDNKLPQNSPKRRKNRKI